LIPALVCLGGLVLLILALLAPLETLRWWAGWAPGPAPDAPLQSASAAQTSPAPLYVVYLSGVAAIDPHQMHEKEASFLDRVAEQIAPAILVRDVFPYSVTNNPLTGERPLAWLWRRVSAMSNKRGKSLADWAGLGLVTVRNMLQVLVSADPRYGPPSSFGVAKEITRALVQSGYRLDSRAPVMLLGYSGGGQVAVGAAPYVRQILQAPISVTGIGGVYSDDPGILAVEHLYQLAGSRDYTRRIGDLLFPGHWFLFPRSAWHHAQRAGKITTLDMGPMKHTLKGDYFSRSSKLADGMSHADKTARTIGALVAQQLTSAGSHGDEGKRALDRTGVAINSA
jgi:hypothetical protein